MKPDYYKIAQLDPQYVFKVKGCRHLTLTRHIYASRNYTVAIILPAVATWLLYSFCWSASKKLTSTYTFLINHSMLHGGSFSGIWI